MKRRRTDMATVDVCTSCMGAESTLADLEELSHYVQTRKVKVRPSGWYALADFERNRVARLPHRMSRDRASECSARFRRPQHGSMWFW
eukprot:SAG11_NODE_29802_length_307_cov_0.740385_1_plen_87_part_01